MKQYLFSKDSDLECPRWVNEAEFKSASYGQLYQSSLKDKPVTYYHFSGSNAYSSEEYNILKSLKNTINYYKSHDDMFDYNNFYNKPIAIYAFNSVHFGTGFKRKSVELNIYLSGSKISTATDRYGDGVLYSGSDEKVGMVLYREGFIFINNTSSLATQTVNFSSSHNQNFQDNPRWVYAFLSSSDCMYYEKYYDINSQIATNISFVYAEKNELNHSNNPTYIESGSYTVSTGSTHFYENEHTKIKKTNPSSFTSGSSKFEKQTFITRIGLYDEEKKLIAVGNLANPVRKTENREYVFKLKLDI